MYKDMMDTIGMVNAADPELGAAMERELTRQRENIELIASENIVSPAVMAAMGSVLTNKYAEGLPGKRYYGGCVYVDEVENIAIQRACQLFGAKYANVQPHSGAQANLAVYFALLELGDTVMGMDLSQGGHLTHGSPVNMSGKNYHFISYGVGADGVIDYAELEKQVRKVRPKMLVAGASAYPRAIDFEKLAEIAHGYGAYLMVDMAHIAGLVAGGQHQSPVPYADVVTTTTHKTLRGPRGGLILTNNEEIAKAITDQTRKGNRIDTTTKLRTVIEDTLDFLPEKEKKDTVRKTCQRVFQALRIDVNQEFEVLYEFMEKLPDALKPGGRVAILTFHSGEDKLVKKALKAGYKAGIYSDYAKDVIRPSMQECAQNGRARSTKMRWAVKAE